MKAAYTKLALDAIEHGRQRCARHFSGRSNSWNRTPSLILARKKYDDSQDIWQAPRYQGLAFYFTVIDDTCHIEDVIPIATFPEPCSVQIVIIAAE